MSKNLVTINISQDAIDAAIMTLREYEKTCMFESSCKVNELLELIAARERLSRYGMWKEQ